MQITYYGKDLSPPNKHGGGPLLYFVSVFSKVITCNDYGWGLGNLYTVRTVCTIYLTNMMHLIANNMYKEFNYVII